MKEEVEDEYELIEEPIEINIEFEEKKEIVVENSLKSVDVKDEIKEPQKILPVTGY